MENTASNSQSQCSKIHTLPLAMPPITNAMGLSFGTRSLMSTTSSVLKDVQTFMQPVGKWSVTGFLIICKEKEYKEWNDDNCRVMLLTVECVASYFEEFLITISCPDAHLV